MDVETMLNKDNIKNFLRNPLGVIALFVTICYLIAGLVFSIGLDKLNGAEERLPFIWFIIIFPVVIFVVFVLLVCYHHEKLYGPTDFKNEDNFVKLTNAERKAKYLSEATENSKYEEQMPINIEDSEEVIKNEKSNICALAFSAENSAHLAIQKLNTIYNTKFTEEVKIGKYRYDAIGAISDRIYLVECKYIKNNITINRLRDTYQQVLRYKENLLKKNPHIIIVFVLEKYTDAVSKNIKEYYQSIAPDIDIYVFDYNELKTQFKSLSSTYKCNFLGADNKQ